MTVVPRQCFRHEPPDLSSPESVEVDFRQPHDANVIQMLGEELLRLRNQGRGIRESTPGTHLQFPVEPDRLDAQTGA